MKKKIIKIFIIELIVVIVIFSFIYFNKKEDSFLSFKSLKSSSLREIIVSKLNLDEKLEEQLEKALIEGEEFVVIRDKAFLKTPDEIFKTLNSIANNNAEIMYYSSVEYKNGTLKINYSKSKDILKNNQTAIREARAHILADILDETMNEYDKVKAIHDYIIKNSNYDKRLFSVGNVPPESYTAYGNLILGTAVCEGYANSMKYFLDDIGIESMIVIGNSKKQDHAWNLIKLDGEYYHLDVTWDDPISDNGEDVLQYNYFNLSDEEIAKTHNWNYDNYPSAIGTKYNYYKYNDLIVNTQNELVDKLQKAMSKKRLEVNFRYSNYQNDNISINKIIEDIAYSNYKSIKLRQYSYSIDENHGIFKINFYYQ